MVRHLLYLTALLASVIASDAQKSLTLRDITNGTLRAEIWSDKKGDSIVSPDGRCYLRESSRQQIYRHSFTADYQVCEANTSHTLYTLTSVQVPLFSPGSKKIAYARENNIFLADIKSGMETQVTTDGRRDSIINGIPDWVNEEEFSLCRSMTFTTDGRHLVWVRYDESQVPSVTIPNDYTYKYPLAGQRNSVVTLHTYSLSSGKTMQIALPIRHDDYIPRITESRGSEVVVCTLNRRQDTLRIYTCDASTGSCQQIMTDTSPKYIKEKAISGMVVTHKHILLPSDRSGWMHLYLYDMKGQLLNQLTKGKYDVADVYGYDERTQTAYYTSHKRGATELQVYATTKDGRTSCLTPQAGWNTAVFTDDFGSFVHTWSDINTPPMVWHRHTIEGSKGSRGSKVDSLLIDNSKLKAKLKEYQFGERKLFSFTTPDGVTLNGWMIVPRSEGKHPVIMYQYGGPGNQQVRNAWGIGMCGQGAAMEQYLCQLGYICVCVDGRGTGGRGSDFEKCTYLRLGQLESQDQVATAAWLAEQANVDKNRIAIWGWSFGGFNSLMSMSDGSNRFAAGIAIAPPTSWRFYDTIYTERYMRTPLENSEGYDDCPLSRADKLHGKLLLCHGMADDNVHFRNTTEYVDTLIKYDKDFRQVIYPHRNHSIRGGNSRYHLFRQCIDFFNSALTPQR